MSTRFTKILTYCVLTMAIIAVVVCAAICMTNAVGVKISLEAKYLTKTTATENGDEVIVKINGQETDELLVGNNSTVTLTFEAPGYNFNGWYNVPAGEYAQDLEAVGNSLTYEFTATKDMNFTAVFDAIKYNVTYKGVGTDIKEELTYGDELAKVNDKVIDNGDGSYEIFVGWKNEEGMLVSSVADFKSTDVVLNAAVKSLEDYKFAFKITKSEINTAGTVYYNFVSGANLNSDTLPKRDFYKISEIIFNGETFDITDKAGINKELAYNCNFNSETNKDIIVNAQVRWELVYSLISFNCYADGETAMIQITNEETQNIEEILLAERLESIVGSDAIGIEVTFNDNQTLIMGEDYNKITVAKFLYLVEATSQEGSIEFEITVKY